MTKEMVEAQRAYFASGATWPLEERKKNLEKIYDLLLKYKDKFVAAFPGSELPRAGGGARCMTMPILREE